MAYPGPWQQLKTTYETRGTGIAYDGDLQALQAEVPQGDRTGDPLYDMTTALGNLEGMAYGKIGTSNAGSAYFGGTLGPRVAPPSKPYGRARKYPGATRIAPTNLAPPASIIPPPPSGSTGYEWQSPNGTVIGGRLQVVNMRATGNADGDPVGSLGDWQAELGIASDTGTIPAAYIGTRLTLDNGLTTYWTQGADPLGGTADITAFVNGQGRFQLLGDTHASVTAFNDDPLVETSWSVNLRFTVRTDDQDLPDVIRVHYTVQPPLFRWLYATPQTLALPPLRTVQRGDGLGASSAPRAVQHQTRQATNRAVSYF